MSDFSPMMRRIRRGNPLKINIPKKGRIRFLIIALLAVLLFNFSQKSIKSNGSGVSEPNLKSKSGSVKIVTPVKTRKPSNQFGINDVSLLLKNTNVKLSVVPDTVFSGKDSLVIYYTLDSSLQKLGNTLMNRYKPLYGAIVAIQPKTGRILSLISFKNDSVTDLGKLYSRSIFPAASIFKTITAAAAIESANYEANCLVQHVGRNHTLYKYQLEKDLKQFTEITFEKAYAMSINPVFARIGIFILGKQKLENYSQKFGFNTVIPFELDVEMSHASSPDSTFDIAELASGFNQQTTISPLHGALLASAISEDGIMPRPFIVDSVINKDSCIYKAQECVWRKTVNKHTASELRKMMYSVSSYGTARKSFKYIRQSPCFDSIQYGGKTGSVDKDSVGRVDWFVGFARDPVDPEKRIAVGVVTAHGAYWTVHSSFIAAEYFRHYIKKKQQEKKLTQQTIVSSDSAGIIQEKVQL